jgi:hypothetical protein
MLKALSQFKPGQTVTLTCYHYGCGGVALEGKLAQPDYIHPQFTGARRVVWNQGTPMLSFHLEKDQSCPVCKTVFDKAIIALPDESKSPIIIGYDDHGGC